MAVKQRGKSWQADIKPPGQERLRPVFKTKEAADLWYASAKLAIASGKPIPRPELSTTGHPETDSPASPGKGARFAAFASRTHTMYWKGKASDGKNQLIIDELKRFFVEDITLDRIDAEMLDRLVESFILKGNSNSTINKKLAVVSRIVRFAHSRGHLNRLPTIERKKTMMGRFRFFTEAEEKTLLALVTQLGKDDHREAIECLIDTGMRPGELYSIPAGDFDLKRRSITIWKNKTDNPRTVYMTDRVARIVARRKSGVTSLSEPLFPYDNTWMRLVWDRVRAMMNLTHDPNFVPYVCRHTCASRMVQRGVPIPVIKEWLGHKTITMTMRYAVLAPTNLMAAVSALEPEKPKAGAEKELEAV